MASRYSDDFGPNVSAILAQATRVVRGRIPQQVRRELSAAVKAGALGHLKKDGLKPEIFFHPDHRNGAIERQNREAACAVSCISAVIAATPRARFSVHQDRDQSGRPAGWYVADNGSPFAFFDRKEQAERCAADHERLAA